MIGVSHRGDALSILLGLCRMALEVIESGKDRQRGNLLAIQPSLRESDYSTSGQFVSRIAGYLEHVRSRRWLGPKTIVVLPEYSGVWWVGAGATDGFLGANTLDAAMFKLILKSPWKFVQGWLRSSAGSRTRDAIFRSRAHSVADLYAASSSELARRFGVTLASGSTILPGAHFDEGKTLNVDLTAPLQQVSIVWGPDGRPLPKGIIKKSFLVRDEQRFLQRGEVEALPVIQTHAGRLGVLICADSWYPQSYEVLRHQKVELIAVPQPIFINQTSLINPGEVMMDSPLQPMWTPRMWVSLPKARPGTSMLFLGECRSQALRPE